MEHLELVDVVVIAGGLCASLVALITPVFLIGKWILSPIDRAARFRNAPARFSLGDFLCLFLAVQLPLTAIYRLVEEDEKRLFWLFTVMTWIGAPLIWIACARTLSKAGVDNSKHRFVFIGLIMPFVYYGLVPFALLTLAGVASLFVDNVPSIGLRTGVMALGWLLLAVVFFLSGLFTRRMLIQASTTMPSSGNSPASGHSSHLGAVRRQ